MNRLFKSEEGKAEILSLYDKKLEQLDIEYESRYVNTRFGSTHVLVTGSKENPPLVIVHGSNGCAPIAIESYPNLSEKFCVYAVDVMAQPNKTDECHLNIKDNSYGLWFIDVLEKLGLNEVILTGFSLGGLVILKSLLVDETRIKSVFLASPAFIVNGNPILALFKMFLPMKKFMKSKDMKFVEQFLAELFSDRDEFAVQYISKILLHFKLDFTPIPTISSKEAASIETPIYLFSAKLDLLFPGEKMIKRAKKIFPSLNNTHLFETSKHVQNRTDNTLIENYIMSNM